jgi:hypothetical protein
VQHSNAERPAFQQLIEGILDCARQKWGETEVRQEEGALHVRLTPASGLQTVLIVERQPDAPFSALYKVECSTLVGRCEPDDSLFEFLDRANTTGFGGAWELFGDGQVGVRGQVVVADPALPWLPRLTGQLVALQVEDALGLGRPENALVNEDLHTPTKPPVEVALHPRLDLSEVAELVCWRSAYHGSDHWEIEAIRADKVTLLAPYMVGEQFRSVEGELLEPLRQVTIARADHPRRGAGILLQVTLLPELREQAIR